MFSFLPSFLLFKLRGLDSYPGGTLTHCSCQPSLDAHFPVLIHGVKSAAQSATISATCNSSGRMAKTAASIATGGELVLDSPAQALACVLSLIFPRLTGCTESVEFSRAFETTKNRVSKSV